LIEVLKLLEAKQLNNIQISKDAHQRCKDQLADVTDLYNQLLTESKQLKLESQKQAHQILMAHEEERKEISRELHDELAQILAGINVRLAVIKETSSINDRNIIKNILKTQKMVEESVDMVHRFAFRLRPAILDDLGLIPALRSYIKELQAHKGLNIRFSASEEAETLDSMRGTALYRIVQEALLNVARHAEAQLATVKIEKIHDQIRLEIHDDGKSFKIDSFLQPTSHQHLGLLGMRERVEMVGGKLSIESEAGKGTTVRAEIPFQSMEN
jgi:signal transduction histidine kinase